MSIIRGTVFAIRYLCETKDKKSNENEDHRSHESGQHQNKNMGALESDDMKSSKKLFGHSAWTRDVSTSVTLVEKMLESISNAENNYHLKSQREGLCEEESHSDEEAPGENIADTVRELLSSKILSTLYVAIGMRLPVAIARWREDQRLKQQQQQQLHMDW